MNYTDNSNLELRLGYALSGGMALFSAVLLIALVKMIYGQP